MRGGGRLGQGVGGNRKPIASWRDRPARDRLAITPHALAKASPPPPWPRTSCARGGPWPRTPEALGQGLPWSKVLGQGPRDTGGHQPMPPKVLGQGPREVLRQGPRRSSSATDPDEVLGQGPPGRGPWPRTPEVLGQAHHASRGPGREVIKMRSFLKLPPRLGQGVGGNTNEILPAITLLSTF